jgi:hypothetical protein
VSGTAGQREALIDAPVYKNNVRYLTRRWLMFRRIGRCRSVFIGMTVMAVLMAIPVNSSFAALVSTEAFKVELDPEHFRTQLQNFLAREDVRVALLKHGTSPTEVGARIATLTDDEVARIRDRIGELPEGGQAAAYIPIWLVILILLGYILVLTGVISLGVYAGVKIQEHQEEEDAKSTPFPAPPRVGPVPSVNPDEPWTGVWKVTDGQATGVYVLKQTGDAIVSTPESDYRLEAKVYGAMIRGSWFDKTARPPSGDFKAIIADDYLSFRGDINSRAFFTCEKAESKSVVVNAKPSGPWEGKWNVQGSPFVSGIWALKQEGETVISTDGSHYRVKGKVAGDKFDGEVMRLGPAREDLKFSFTLLSDGKSFHGYVTEEKTGVSQISGVKSD